MDELIVNAVEELDEDRVIDLAQKALSDGMKPLYLLELVKCGMSRVGKRYENKQYFIADLIMAGLIFKEVLKLDKMTEEFNKGIVDRMNKVIVGTVKGDLHDIGKDIFKGLLDAHGFNVIDLGVDVPAEAFVEAVKMHKPDIVGLSGVLNFTIDTMKETVEALRCANVRDKVMVILGGNHLTKEALEYIGADYYTNDASIGVKVCKKWVNTKNT